MRRIYFAGSIRGGRDDAALYLEIIKHLKHHGKVLTEHIGDSKLSESGELLGSSQIHQRDMEWLCQSDVVIAEVTKASLGVGYELGTIRGINALLPETQKKRVLCLYRPQSDRKLSAMIEGSDGFYIEQYTDLDQVKIAIDKFLATVIGLPKHLANFLYC